jgi:hypothetical protein
MRYAYYEGRPSVFIPGGLGEKENLPVIVWIHGYLLAPFFIYIFSLIVFSIRKRRVYLGQRVPLQW